MGASEIAAAFRSALALEAPREPPCLDNLTPQDFAIVARKAQTMDCRDAAKLTGWLREGASAKPDRPRRRIGF